LVTGAVLWLVGFAAFTCSLGIGPAVTLTRLEPSPAVLTIPTSLAMPLALVLAALTGCSLAAAVIAGDATLVGSSVPVFVALVIGCAASLAALVSSGRAARTLRSA
jgi:hypothetical protein